MRNFVILLAAALMPSLVVRGASPPTTQPQTDVATEYSGLVQDVINYNSDGIDSWTMNSEHLFADAGALRDRTIAFVRRPGALDLLFGKVLDDRTSATEVLASVEMLVYFGQYDQPGDEQISSDKTALVMGRIDHGGLVKAEKKYPGAPIKEQLLRAIHKLQQNARATHPDTNPSTTAH